jgi:hypothetical protein
MKIKGEWETRRVWLDGKELNPDQSQKVYNHSPDGFNWSYGGSGPAQLALAILLEKCTKEEALKRHQDFKWAVIAGLPQSNFEIEINLDSILS